LKHLILTNDLDKDGIIRLEGKDYHYLVNVRRLAVGECFSALLPGGEELLIKIVSINNGTLTGKCETSALSSSSALCGNNSDKIPPIILFQALPKGDKMDLIVRQAAESGVAEIVPFTAEFSAGKGNVGESKFLRWEKIIKEARQQSGSRISTALRRPVSVSGLLEYWKKLKGEGALALLFHHEKGVEQNSLHGYLNNEPKNVVLAVGPEGGFSGKEVALFMENGFKPITIGDTVLRTETAALYFTAAVRILLLEKNTWELKLI